MGEDIILKKSRKSTDDLMLSIAVTLHCARYIYKYVLSVLKSEVNWIFCLNLFGNEIGLGFITIAGKCLWLAYYTYENSTV